MKQVVNEEIIAEGERGILFKITSYSDGSKSSHGGYSWGGFVDQYAAHTSNNFIIDKALTEFKKILKNQSSGKYSSESSLRWLITELSKKNQLKLF